MTVRNLIISVFGASHHNVDAFPRAQIEILKALAGHIAVAVDNAQRFQDERRQMQRLHEEQDEARRIQENLLPRTAPSLPGFQLEAECVPAGAVGGDWYDYIPLNEGRVAILLADVSGKGMPAALLMSAVRAIVRFFAPLTNGPGEMLSRLNQMLLNDFPTEHYVTMIYAVLDSAPRTLTFASAGHPWPLLCHGTDVRPLHTDAGMPLGLLPGEFTEHTVKFCRDFRLHRKRGWDKGGRPRRPDSWREVLPLGASWRAGCTRIRTTRSGIRQYRTQEARHRWQAADATSRTRGETACVSR